MHRMGQGLHAQALNDILVFPRPWEAFLLALLRALMRKVIIRLM